MKNAGLKSKLFTALNNLSPHSIDSFALVTRPDPISNIRVVRYRVNPSQSLARCQAEARRLRATKRWHEFWTAHNTEYNAKYESLVGRYGHKDEIPSRELNKFYKDHLEAHRERHREFNRWWLRENFTLLWLHMRCWFIEHDPRRRYESGFFRP